MRRKGFWEMVDRNGPQHPRLGTCCWLWTGWRDNKGYGRMRLPGSRSGRYANRVSWQIHFGAIPSGVIVRHRCDNPSCVRPDHLELGTHQDNSDDKIVRGRGRWARGAAQHRAKLTDDAVREIRRLRAQGVPLKAIAAQFGITMSNVSQIARRKTWTHVE